MVFHPCCLPLLSTCVCKGIWGRFKHAALHQPSPASWDSRVSLSSPSLLSVLGRLLSYIQQKISYTSEGSVQSHEKVWGGGCWPSLWPGLLMFLISHTSSHFVSKTSPIWHDFSLFLLPPFLPGMKATMSILWKQYLIFHLAFIFLSFPMG